MKANFPPGESPSASPAANERLDSWKEIAAYLRREERTVRRWEKSEGLPVRRHVHTKLPTVYAYKSELDAWWNNRRPRLEQKESAQAQLRHRVTWSAAAALVVALALSYFAWSRIRRPPPAAPGRIVLAVLPFQNLSTDPDQEFFSDGLTEEMITELGRLKPSRLAVIARTSVMRYEATQKPVDEIGHDLRADFLLEGTVRRLSQVIRVTAQLICVRDQTHLWADSYETQVRDAVTLQKQVAQTIARQINLTLSPEARTRLESKKPVDPEAYDNYLKGRFYMARRVGDNVPKAIGYFNQTVEKDPGYAPAFQNMPMSR